jgi:hypothetical protein
MGLIASDSGGGDFKLIPAGVHIGRCFRIVDLGTQEEVYEGEAKLLPKVAIYWELHGEEEDGTPLMADNGEPLVIWQEYTKSLGQKAKLRAALESWRGKPFSEDELKGFDISKLLNAYCMVNVTHKTSQKGKTYANVASLTPLPAALRHSKPNPVLPSAIFDLDNFNEALFNTFHDKLKEKINNSIERKGGGKSVSAGHADANVPAEAYDEELGDCPF